METCTYDHIDFRVRDLTKLIPFYDALMPALGLRVISRGSRSREYFHPDKGLPFFGLHKSVTSVPNRSRIAFAAVSRQQVDRIATVVRKAGGNAIEGPEVCASYGPRYYALFFEDPDGNKFEVCCRR